MAGILLCFLMLVKGQSPQQEILAPASIPCCASRCVSRSVQSRFHCMYKMFIFLIKEPFSLRHISREGFDHASDWSRCHAVSAQFKQQLEILCPGHSCGT